MKNRLVAILFVFLLSNNTHAIEYESMGDAVQYALPLTALGMTFTNEDPEGRMQFYKSFGATFGATYTIKLGVNRTRPNGADYSFPSGHASASFSSAAYIHQRYGNSKGRIAYFAAAFVGWSRIQANKHYVSDVLAGALLGTVTSYIYTSDKDISLGAYKDGDATGINIQFNW